MDGVVDINVHCLRLPQEKRSHAFTDAAVCSGAAYTGGKNGIGVMICKIVI